jgi:hypothetical protein
LVADSLYPEIFATAWMAIFRTPSPTFNPGQKKKVEAKSTNNEALDKTKENEH